MFRKRKSWTPLQSSSRLVMRRNRLQQQPDKSVCRLQNCMPLRFHEMVKTHLSALLDVKVCDLDTMMTVQPAQVPKQKSAMSFCKKKVHKQSVTTSNLSQENLKGVLELIDHISSDTVIATEGLFRKTGNICRQKQLKAKLTTGNFSKQDLVDLSPHDCTNVLKSYISSLSEPLLTRKMFNVYIKIANITRPTKEETKTATLNAIQLVLHLLPTDNLNLLKPLVTLLHKTANVTSNLMSAYSLGILFAPHLLCDRSTSLDSLQSSLSNIADIVTVMIENGSKIFNTPRELSLSASAFWREMEVPNELYYSNVKSVTDSVQVTTTRTSPKVHVVDLSHKESVPEPQEPVTPLPANRKRLNSDCSEEIPEKRPSPEIFLSPACKDYDFKPKLSKRSNSIVFDRQTDKPLARVEPMPQSPITQFLKSVPMKLQRVMTTPRSRAPMALVQSPCIQSTKF